MVLRSSVRAIGFGFARLGTLPYIADVRVPLSLASGLVIVAAANPVFAQSDLERAAARDAANDGLAAYNAGHYEQAIDSVSHAEQLVHAPTHILIMARSQAKLGRLVAARESYVKLTREVLAPNAPKPFVAAQAAGQEELAAVEERLPTVVVTLQGATPAEASVDMDGTKLPAAMIGIRLPVDPGQHVFKASTATAQSEPVTVTLAEAATQTVLLALQPHDVSVPGAGPLAPSVGVGGPLAAASNKSTTHPMRIASYVSLGVGALGVGFGTALLLKSASTRHKADTAYDACKAAAAGGKCSDPGSVSAIESQDKDADGQHNLGLGALVVGGVGVVTGVTLLILDLRNTHTTEQAAAPRLVPLIGLRSFALAGTF
jgi:hypothetical protein